MLRGSLVVLGNTTRVQAYAEWNGRTPTAGELEEYWAEARRQRRAQHLTHAIQRAIDRNPELALRLTPVKLPGDRHGVELDDETRSQLRETLRRT